MHVMWDITTHIYIQKYIILTQIQHQAELLTFREHSRRQQVSHTPSDFCDVTPRIAFTLREGAHHPTVPGLPTLYVDLLYYIFVSTRKLFFCKDTKQTSFFISVLYLCFVV